MNVIPRMSKTIVPYPSAPKILAAIATIAKLSKALKNLDKAVIAILFSKGNEFYFDKVLKAKSDVVSQQKYCNFIPNSYARYCFNILRKE
jgi:hypothetical protein